jgi:hypothetical protein
MLQLVQWRLHVRGTEVRANETIQSRGLRKALHAGLRTNVAREHKEVIVSQTTVLLRIDEGLDVNSIALLVLVLEHLEGFGVVQSVGGGVDHGVAVGDRHD